MPSLANRRQESPKFIASRTIVGRHSLSTVSRWLHDESNKAGETGMMNRIRAAMRSLAEHAGSNRRKGSCGAQSYTTHASRDLPHAARSGLDANQATAFQKPFGARSVANSVGAWVSLLVDRSQIRSTDVRVDLRRTETLVPQQFLHTANVCTTIQQMGCEAMT